jgi:hypothetical protein
LVKHAKKVILSDAMITDAFELVKNRAPGLMIKNEFKKFQDTPAIRMRDEADCFASLERPLHHKSTIPFRL